MEVVKGKRDRDRGRLGGREKGRARMKASKKLERRTMAAVISLYFYIVSDLSTIFIQLKHT